MHAFSAHSPRPSGKVTFTRRFLSFTHAVNCADPSLLPQYLGQTSITAFICYFNCLLPFSWALLRSREFAFLIVSLQHRAQCVTPSGHAIITTFQWEASAETVWPADTDAIQRLQLFGISCILDCLVPLSKKLAHPWFLCMILFSVLVCQNSQRMVQSYRYIKLCFIELSLKLGAVGEKFGNLWALYKKDLDVRVSQFPYIQQ